MGKPRTGAQSLVLSDAPLRVRLRALREQLDECRDQIAELDLEIETLRDQLVAFEATMEARLALEHRWLARIEAVVRQIERWAQLLEEASRPTIGARARRLDERRTREIGNRDASVPEEEPEGPALEPAEPDERLKSAYRRLARRFHPDLARTEEERLKNGQTMARINELYRERDLARLEAMVEQLKGGEVEDTQTPLEQQVAELEERLAWFQTVLLNLRQERNELERSRTCELWRNAEQASMAGRDLIEEIRAELKTRVQRSFADVGAAIRILEAEVERYNRDHATALSARPRRATALDRRFDPFTDKRLVRLSLEALATCRTSPAAQRLAGWILEGAQSKPALARLLLLTYVCELSPYPLTGLETYDDLRTRFEHLGAADGEPLSLEATLVEGDEFVEYGVARLSDKVAHLGLRFRSETVREAMPVALQSVLVRREFKRILGVLGERGPCSGCGQEVFAVPLYRTRGLDDLRANLCPSCGHILSSYWMPRGKDVQAVLNTAYLDFEIVTEWSFRLARASVAMQLLPVQLEQLTVGDLKKRLVADLFDRYRLEIQASHFALRQGKRSVPDKTSLAELESRRFVLRFSPDSPLTENDALELLRHRIRNHFKE